MQSPAQRPFAFINVLWLAWLAFAVLLTWPGMKWEVTYFDNPQPYFYRVFLVLLAASPLLLIACGWLRRWILRRHEVAVFAGLVVGMCAVYEPWATVLTALVFMASYAAGRRAIRTLRLTPSGPVEDLALSTAAGLGLLQCVLFFIGVMGGYIWPVFLAVIAIPLLFCIPELRSLYKTLYQIDALWSQEDTARSWAGTLLAISALLGALITAAYALAPTIYYDSLNLHLPVIRYFAEHHTLLVYPHMPYSYYPHGVETVMTLGYTLGGQRAAQLIPEVYLVTAMITLFCIGRHSGMDRFTAVAGIVFALSIPALHWTGSSGKNDLGLAMFLWSALLGVLRWRESRQWSWILLAAFFLAMAAGVKHIVLFAVPPFAVFFAYAVWRQERRVTALAQVIGILVVFGLFWHARAWLTTGNPLYPAPAVTAATKFVPAPRSSFIRDVVWPYVRFPWELHFRGRHYYESASEYPMGILLVLFLPMWLLARRLNRSALLVLAFCGAYIWYWAVAVGMLRYAIAPIAIVCAFTGWLALEFSQTAPPVIRFSVFAACFYAFLFSLCGITVNEISAPQIRYFAKRIDATEYLREALPPYRALEFVNHRVKRGDTILGVDACAAAYMSEETAFTCLHAYQKDEWQQARAGLSRGDYKFVVVPRSPALDIPPGLAETYSDDNFMVFHYDAAAPARSDGQR